jgi:adenosine deaminase
VTSTRSAFAGGGPATGRHRSIGRMPPDPGRSARPTVSPSPAGLRAELAGWPKAELHLHLDGSLLVETAIELARTRRIDAPTDIDGMRAVLVAPERCGSQAELLRAFDLPIALMQDAEALERITRELVEAKALDGVRYVEIRWGPLLHVARGLSLADGIAAVCSGAEAGARASAAAGRPVLVRLIATALRSHEPEANVGLAEAASAFRDRGLVGWDLAGPEEAYPDPLIHRRAFDAARAGGLRITIHAGEWGGAAQVRRALAVEPQRIAHGPGAIDDPDLCAELIARGIALDLAPTSNVQAGIVESVAAHPLPRLHRLGVPVTLSTDDPTVSDITLAEEYARVVEQAGVTLDDLWSVDRLALDVAFASEADLEPLRAEFDAWRAATPGT